MVTIIWVVMGAFLVVCAIGAGWRSLYSFDEAAPGAVQSQERTSILAERLRAPGVPAHHPKETF
jgi:hypothetical protein